MFPPMISLRREPGIKFLNGLGIDVPAYNFSKAWVRIKFLHGLGVDVPAYNLSKAWARLKISS